MRGGRAFRCGVTFVAYRQLVQWRRAHDRFRLSCVRWYEEAT
ncbi:hypothetical protein AK34_5327 [Burkholderia dolosa AU0158]|nr:hypothetical protein AK34_5327 [Burkholderia dolosa AU0158]